MERDQCWSDRGWCASLEFAFECLVECLPTRFPVALLHLGFCWFGLVKNDILQSLDSKDRERESHPLRLPTSKENTSASVDLRETEVCFLHIQLVGTDVRLVPCHDLQQSHSAWVFLFRFSSFVTRRVGLGADHISCQWAPCINAPAVVDNLWLPRVQSNLRPCSSRSVRGYFDMDSFSQPRDDQPSTLPLVSQTALPVHQLSPFAISLLSWQTPRPFWSSAMFWNTPEPDIFIFVHLAFSITECWLVLFQCHVHVVLQHVSHLPATKSQTRPRVWYLVDTRIQIRSTVSFCAKNTLTTSCWTNARQASDLECIQHSSNFVQWGVATFCKEIVSVKYHGRQNDYQHNSWKQFNLQSHKQKKIRQKNRVRGWQPVILKIRNYSRVCNFGQKTGKTRQPQSYLSSVLFHLVSSLLSSLVSRLAFSCFLCPCLCLSVCLCVLLCVVLCCCGVCCGVVVCGGVWCGTLEKPVCKFKTPPVCRGGGGVKEGDGGHRQFCLPTISHIKLSRSPEVHRKKPWDLTHLQSENRSIINMFQNPPIIRFTWWSYWAPVILRDTAIRISCQMVRFVFRHQNPSITNDLHDLPQWFHVFCKHLIYIFSCYRESTKTPHKQATAQAHVRPHCVWLNFEQTKNSNRSKKFPQRRKSNSTLLIYSKTSRNRSDWFGSA